MRKKDLIFGFGVILIALAMMLCMKIVGETEGDQVKITVDGKIYGTYSLNKEQEIEIDAGEDHNKICIHDGAVYMKEANCPDGYCMEQGKISGRKQTIVCLPHKLVVEVTGTEKSGEADERDIPDTVAK